MLKIRCTSSTEDFLTVEQGVVPTGRLLMKVYEKQDRITSGVDARINLSPQTAIALGSALMKWANTNGVFMNPPSMVEGSI